MKLENFDQIQALASEYIDYFSPIEASEGGVLLNTYVIDNGSPEKIQELVNHVQDGEDSSRWYHKYIVDTLNIIINTASEHIEQAIDDLEAFEHNYDLVDWLRSDIRRHRFFVDDVVNESGGDNFDILIAIARGQIAQKEQVFRRVLTYFNKLVNGEDADFDD